MVDKSQLRSFFNSSKYEVELFRRENFIRKQCTVCNGHYWTLENDSDTCGDTSCVGSYQFIGKPSVNWSLDDTITNMTRFFEKNGHTPIDPYPVVARWRNDIQFTIASIADFQPWVLSGVVDPPANPLTVPQPCVRFGGDFNDLDNIGKTGRHFTSFIMFGQHAFNSKKLTNGYWMDRCIDLNFEFLTTELKLKPEEIKYKEDIWIGGGNFGPNLESMAKGSELVNSVFMQYEILPDGSHKEMDMTVIDVGWGAERVAWFTQGTATIYEAIVEPTLNYYKKVMGFKGDDKLAQDYFTLAGLLDVNESIDLKDAKLKISEQLGYDQTELVQKIEPYEVMYGITDHIRTLVFAFADGAIPSNVGGGYNIRVMIRRIFSLMDAYDLNIDPIEMAMIQIDDLKKTFPRVVNAQEIVKILFPLERKRYETNKKSGARYVKNLLSSKKEIKPKDFLEMYESRGISPETITEIARENNVKIEIPPDFYSLLSQARLKSISEEEKSVEMGLVEMVKGLPETHKTYYDDVYQVEHSTKLLEVIDSQVLVFESTIFYPEGGGQAPDNGQVIIEGKEYNIINVQSKGPVVLHWVDKPISLSAERQEVQQILDSKRRRALMRNHTATHIINGAAQRVLGAHVWQEGADKTPEKARLDLSHYEHVTHEQLQEIEMIANQIVMDNRPIHHEEMERTVAEQEYGFRIYQGGAVPGKNLKIISVDGHDTEACGGTHLKKTGEVGLIKVLGAERIQDGVIRLSFSAGEAAIKAMQEENRILISTAEKISVQPEALPQSVERFFEEWKNRAKEIAHLQSELAKAKIPLLIDHAEKIGSTRVIFEEISGERDELVQIVGKLISEAEDLLVVLVNKNKKVAVIVGRSEGSNIPHLEVAKALSNIVGGGAGGRGDLIMGGGPKIASFDQLLEEGLKIIKQKLV
ncbi:MAG: alanine--tRNA ligase [Candidatus Kariarchaeaceae archaeon]